MTLGARIFEKPENVAEAKRLFRDGLLDGEVADRMGSTRTSVAKMRAREGIESNYNNATRRRNALRGGAIAEQKKHRKSALERGAAARINRSLQEGVRLPSDTRKLAGPAWRPLGGTSPVPLVDLERGMCKWPIGEDRPYLFCGAAAEGSYCPTHTALATGRGTEAERAAHRARAKVRAA